MAEAARRPRRQVRAARRGHHGQGQRRGAVAVRGVLREILAEEGATVPNNAEIAVIETAEEARARAAAHEPARGRRPPTAAETAEAAGKIDPSRQPPIRRPGRGPQAGPRPRPSRRSAGIGSSPPPAAAAALRPPPRPHRPRRPGGTGDPDARMTPAVRRLLREHALQPTRSSAQVVVAESLGMTSWPSSSRSAPAARPLCR